ncbi:hypothetical protein [uncultured Tateyamaria sp.]|uniref:hypothetical protein n=1 Tax=uncultured Tateyamaria sp. TaxID=455651 RepID=UPI0026137BED|nr:hypothetical protein [uncultured Tateyamaria sp.]
MLQALPFEFWAMVTGCIVLMAVAAFFLSAPQWWQRGLARSALVIAGAGLFVGTLTYLSLFAAILIVVLPMVLIIAFFSNIFGGLF